MPRLLIDKDPLTRAEPYAFSASPWPAKWIGPREVPTDAGVWAFRRSFVIQSQQTLRLHVSADQRYILFIDGRREGRGPERGDPRHWMYDSYDIDLPAGEHTIVAIVWWANLTGPTPPPWSQMTERPGFLLMAEGAGAENIHTGDGWTFKPVTGVSFDSADQTSAFIYCVGPHVRIDGQTYPWGVERGDGTNWQPAPIIQSAAVASQMREGPPFWLLRPAMLPAMIDRSIQTLTLRHLDAPSAADTRAMIVRHDQQLTDEADAWQAMLVNQQLNIPAHSRRRAIIDLKRYACAYTHFRTHGGRGATVRVRWAEALYEYDPAQHKRPRDAQIKANRDDIDGRIFFGIGDTFIADGDANRAFETLWWNAGRYLELYIETKDQPLTIDGFELRETGYPYTFDSTFVSSDDRLTRVGTRALHTLRMCSHETSMDCPYYEQLNYAGDTRLQSLVAMTHSPDNRLVRKSIKLFDWSRTGDTWTASRYPTSAYQVIPTFSLWWVGMVYDYALWRGDRAFVLSVMPGVRSVVERWREQIDDRGLVRQPAGWNFTDWASGWKSGVVNPVVGTPCGVIQWQLSCTLMQLADLEEMLNEPLLAQRNRQTAAALAAAAERFFFDSKRRLLADNLEHSTFSEHAQALALLSGQLSENLRPDIAKGLDASADLTQTTVYFRHYAFEALRELGKMETIIDRMAFWFDHDRLGLSTLLEKPEPSRSDCHAWGSHPAYHFLASILGIRPASFGFGSVEIRPQLGPLAWARGAMAHPLGKISVEVRREVDTLHGIVHLPPGVGGRLIVNGDVSILEPGTARSF